MKIVFAGKFESALVRSIDEILTPRRNASIHEYYAGLNRRVPKSYADRCGTFIAIAEEVLVPQIDWNYPIDRKYRGELEEVNLGVESTSAGGREWDEDTKKLVKFLMRNDVLSANSLGHISTLSLAHYTEEDRAHVTKNLGRYSEAVSDHYLNRLFLQLKAARDAQAFAVVGEEDIQILTEIGQYLLSNKIPTRFEIPDLRGKLIEPDSFSNGILNFAPPDIHSVAAVRLDTKVREYSAKIDSLLLEAPSIDRDRRMLAAMIEAHEKSEAGRRAQNVFEVASWVVKPLHYVPVLGEVIAAAEDVKDVAKEWAKRKTEKESWYLLGVRMSDIAIKDYLNRKSNIGKPKTVGRISEA